MSKEEAFDKAMRLLSSHAHSVNELRSKLYRKGFSSQDIAFALNECKRLRLVDDEQFARDYGSEVASRGCGSLKIRNSLRMKGIDRELTAKTLEELSGDEFEHAVQALNSKLRSLSRETDMRKKRDKACRFLASRGFKFDIIRKAFDQCPELSFSPNSFEE
ncbi:MAG: regulatory protein RecX [Victivallaceae bacterium]